MVKVSHFLKVRTIQLKLDRLIKIKLLKEFTFNKSSSKVKYLFEISRRCRHFNIINITLKYIYKIRIIHPFGIISGVKQ